VLFIFVSAMVKELILYNRQQCEQLNLLLFVMERWLNYPRNAAHRLVLKAITENPFSNQKMPGKRMIGLKKFSF